MYGWKSRAFVKFVSSRWSISMPAIKCSHVIYKVFLFYLQGVLGWNDTSAQTRLDFTLQDLTTSNKKKRYKLLTDQKGHSANLINRVSLTFRSQQGLTRRQPVLVWQDASGKGPACSDRNARPCKFIRPVTSQVDIPVHGEATSWPFSCDAQVHALVHPARHSFSRSRKTAAFEGGPTLGSEHRALQWCVPSPMCELKMLPSIGRTYRVSKESCSQEKNEAALQSQLNCLQRIKSRSSLDK